MKCGDAFGDAVADAYGHSIRHRVEIEVSDRCGCFYRMHIFGREPMEEWIDGGRTALCVRTAESTRSSEALRDTEISVPFLTRMHAAWFEAQ